MRPFNNNAMNQIIIDKSYFAEVVCPLNGASAAQQTYFPTLDNLKNKFIQGVSFYAPSALPKTQSNAVVANVNVLKSSFLTLVTGNENEIWNIPVIDLIFPSTVAVGSLQFTKTQFNNLSVIWTKSYIFVADITTYAATAENWAINISYTDNKI